MKINKQVREWTIWAVVMAVLYFSGGYTFLAAQMQRLILFTGILNASPPQEVLALADYNFELVDLEGNYISLEQLKGKTIFMNFWATWCPPCRAEMPSILALYQKMNPQIAFVMISSDHDLDKLKKFAQDYPFKIYRTSHTPSVYYSSAIPTTFVISPKGEIVYKKEGMARYDTDDFMDFLKKTNTE